MKITKLNSCGACGYGDYADPTPKSKNKGGCGGFQKPKGHMDSQMFPECSGTDQDRDVVKKERKKKKKKSCYTKPNWHKLSQIQEDKSEEQYVVWREDADGSGLGDIYFKGIQAECYNWLGNEIHKNHSYSIDWAMKNEGWQVIPYNSAINKAKQYTDDFVKVPEMPTKKDSEKWQNYVMDLYNQRKNTNDPMSSQEFENMMAQAKNNKFNLKEAKLQKEASNWECVACGHVFNEAHTQKPTLCPMCGSSGKNVFQWNISDFISPEEMKHLQPKHIAQLLVLRITTAEKRCK